MPQQHTGRRLAAVLVVSLWAGLAGCSGDTAFESLVISPDSVAALDADAVDGPDPDETIRVLWLDTPDGLQQTVHPDYAAMPSGKPRRFLVATPYAFSSNSSENPTLYAQAPDHSWSLYGATNPIARPKSGYLSDPDIVALPDRNELWVYYREVTGENTILLRKSTDGGASWGERLAVVAAPNHAIVSPSVVRRTESAWMMWSVNAGKEGCSGRASTIELRRSRDGMSWSKPVPVSLVQTGYKIWHIEVQWIAALHEYWAVYNVKRGASCRTDLLFLATSPDGMTWTTYPSPLLAGGAIPEFRDVVYRSTFAYNPRADNVRFWYSGAAYADGDYIWRTAVQKRSRSSVFASITLPASRSLGVRRGPEPPGPIDPP